MSLNTKQEQELLMHIEGILGDYDETISRSDLVAISVKLDEKFPNLNFVVSCDDEVLKVSYFDCHGSGSRFEFGLGHAPLVPQAINN